MDKDNNNEVKEDDVQMIQKLRPNVSVVLIEMESSKRENTASVEKLPVKKVKRSETEHSEDKYCDALARKLHAVEEELKASNGREDAMRKKYSAWSSNLRDQLECPVCMEVPTSGPVHVCPNGHSVCSSCKTADCPTCRTKMFNGKSLLAQTVIENIEHKCKFVGCEELLGLKEYKIHIKRCQLRPVQCPAPQRLCGKEMALNRLYDHIVSECKGSHNERVPGIFNHIFPFKLNYPSASEKGFALCYKGVHFYLSAAKSAGFNVYSVELLGPSEDCKDYEVSITAHKLGERELKGKHVQRFSGEPLAFDVEPEVKKKNGLIVGAIQMKNISMKKGVKGCEMFVLTVDIKK